MEFITSTDLKISAVNKLKCFYRRKKIRYYYPVDTRHRFNVYTTSIRRQRRRTDVV